MHLQNAVKAVNRNLCFHDWTKHCYIRLSVFCHTANTQIPGSNPSISSCDHHDSRCNIQPSALLYTLTTVPACTQSSTSGKIRIRFWDWVIIIMATPIWMRAAYRCIHNPTRLAPFEGCCRACIHQMNGANSHHGCGQDGRTSTSSQRQSRTIPLLSSKSDILSCRRFHCLLCFVFTICRLFNILFMATFWTIKIEL